MNYENLLNTIRMNVYSNGSELITGDVLQSVLNDMVDSVASGYLFKGLAQPTTNPGTPDENVAYVAGPGTYTYFGGLTVPEGNIAALLYDGTWTMDLIAGIGGGAAILRYVAIASIADLPDPGVDGTGYLVGQNLYLYVGTGGDTADGKYQDCGAFRGPQGNTGSSVDYPFELANNLTTNDPTKGLSAAQGVVLEGEIEDLQDKVDGFESVTVDEDGLFVVDMDLNIGVKVDEDGIHAKNILEYEIIG